MTHRDGFPRLSARSAWRGDAGHSEAARDAARKPWEAAFPVALASRPWAVESHAVGPQRPRRPDPPHPLRGRALLTASRVARCFKVPGTTAQRAPNWRAKSSR